MLPTFVFDKAGDAYLNTLRRFAFSSLIVPAQNLGVATMLPAPSLAQPSASLEIPIQGPDDGSTELYTLTGTPNGDDTGEGGAAPAVRAPGIGTITTDGITSAIVGVGTKFTTQLVPLGSETVHGANLAAQIASIQSDTLATAVGVPAATTDSPFWISYFNAQRAACFLTIRDLAYRRQLMNRDVPAMHVFGSPQKPSFLKESLLLELDQTLLLKFLNYSTSNANFFQPMTEGRKWQYTALQRKNVAAYIAGLQERKRILQPYWMTLDNGWIDIPAGQTVTQFFTCTGDITCVLFNLMGTVVSQAWAISAIDPAFQMFDAKTGRALQIGEQYFSSGVGSAENPFILPQPLVVEPQTQIKVQIRNPGDTTIRVMMTFHGSAAYTGSSWTGGSLTEANVVKESDRLYRAVSQPTVMAASPHN